MRKNISTMSIQEIERELENFAWEYVALADKAQTDEYYGNSILDTQNLS